MDSKQLAQTWPFPRYRAYQRRMRETVRKWLDSKGLPRDSKYAFILDKWEHWPSNLILTEVSECIQEHKSRCESLGFAPSPKEGPSRFITHPIRDEHTSVPTAPVTRVNEWNLGYRQLPKLPKAFGTRRQQGKASPAREGPAIVP